MTATTVAPTTNCTWWPRVSASASGGRIVTVEAASFAVAETVVSATSLATLAAYRKVSPANVPISIPDNVSPLSFAPGGSAATPGDGASTTRKGPVPSGSLAYDASRASAGKSTASITALPLSSVSDNTTLSPPAESLKSACSPGLSSVSSSAHTRR